MFERERTQGALPDTTHAIGRRHISAAAHLADTLHSSPRLTFLTLSYFSILQVKTKRTSLCREIVREVVGLSPYERRILDMIKTGGSSADKRIYKFAKKRLGSHKRALAKREDIKEVNSKQRARQAGVN